MDYRELRKNDTPFLALTSFYVTAFDILLSHFAPHWQANFRYHTLEGRYHAASAY